MIGQVVVDMKLLTNHVQRAEFLACAWEHYVRNWTMENVNGIFLKISYKFRLT